MRRRYWEKRILSLDPEDDWQEIARITTAIEFPWDVRQALALALLRTCAVPSIGAQLGGETAEQIRRRCDDTVLSLRATLRHGSDVGPGEALRDRMQAHYPFSDDDVRYVLSAFVVVPSRWIDDFGWRPLWLPEERALVRCHRELGRNLGVQDLPDTYEELEELMTAYEREHFAYDSSARIGADVALDVVARGFPRDRLPQGLAVKAALALVDDHVLEALRYERPNGLFRGTVRAGLKARAEVVARMRPRTEPVQELDQSQVSSHPGRSDVADPGTSPGGDDVGR